MNSSKLRRILVPASVLAVAVLASELQAAAKFCCDIIRVDSAKGSVWVRNPVNGLLAQFHAEPGENGRFKVGDRFNPDTNALNGTKLDTKYVLMEPDLDPPNASILRVTGSEIAATVKGSGKLYRFYALSFGPVLSSLRPGQNIVIDEIGRWAIIRWVSHTEPSIMGKESKLKPQTYAFKLK
jgi:hypothetical protein